MTTEIDLRDATDAGAVRHRIHEALETTEAGDAIDVVADRNVEAALIRYQIERDVELDREYESTGPDRWALTVTNRGATGEGERPAFDARHLPPQQRHSTLTAAFDDLAVDEGFRLVNDHDPKPLYHQFDAEAGPEFRWEYRKTSPGEFRVLVGRAEDVTATDVAESTDGAEPADGGAEAPF